MSSSDVQVQGSNDWSIASKLSTVSAGYYEDLFISCFVEKPVRRSSLIHRGYYVRAKAMSYIFETFLAQHPKCQIVSFGAGFDTSYFMLKHHGHNNCQYVEIDFPDVVAKKWQLIKNHTCCSELAMGNQLYHLVSADLRNPSALSNILFENGHLLDPSEPTLLISECAITYMDETSSSKLIEWCGHTFANAVFAVYEQIRPTDGFGRVMQHHFIQLSIPLLSLPVFPDKESQRHRYLSKGWTSCQVYDINEFVQELIPSCEFERMKRLETFDEYEGFHEKCAHYIILTATKGSCLSPLPIKRETLNGDAIQFKSWVARKSSIQRYGQAGVADRDGMWMAGGFGSRPQGHGRLDHLIFVDPSGSVDVKLTDKRLARVYHSLHLIQSEYLLVYGGRTHPGKALGDIGFIDLENIKDIEWLEVAANEWPEARWRHASIDIHPSQVFIGGGCTPDKVLNDCWLMRVDVQTAPPSVDWISFLSLPSGRHSATASYWNDSIIISGGLTEDERICPAPMLVSPITNGHQRWTEPTWKGCNPPAVSRYSHQALVTSDDRLILVGGVTTNCRPAPPGVCVIQLQNWTCIEYNLPTQEIQFPVMLVNFNAQLIEDRDENKIIVRCWGGGSPCFSFGTHLNQVFVEIEL